MAIPVHLQQFKAAGVYRVVFDKSTILNEDTSIIRLVVGYSEVGPFNVPVYVRDPQEFTALFGGTSKKLEKRGIWFHRMALQMLRRAPILCLNLKKFENECVKGASISTDFNPKYDIIDTVTLKVEDIYDTTRFWNLDPTKLNDLRTVDGSVMDQYINLTVIDTHSVTYFIRKASGRKVSGYNITVNDWYSNETMPEYMEKYKSNLISDFFAEIYVFKGKFTAQQVLASSTLKNYFIVKNEEDEQGDKILQLRPYVLDAYGDPVDTLDMLYADETSNALGHWVGSLIPYFKNKQNSYEALDIIFNSDSDTHHMMMSFNIDLLEEEDVANIDLSGRMVIPQTTDQTKVTIKTNSFLLEDIYKGQGKTSLLGNNNAPIISDSITFESDVYNNGIAIKPLYAGKTKITGTLYVTSIDGATIHLKQVGTDEIIDIYCESEEEAIKIAKAEFKVQFDEETNSPIDFTGAYASCNDAFEDETDPLKGPSYVITSISRVEDQRIENETYKYNDADSNLKATVVEVKIMPHSTYNFNEEALKTVYGSSISFIKYPEYTIDSGWKFGNPKEDGLLEVTNGANQEVLYCTREYDRSLLTVLNPKDALLADDGTLDANDDKIIDNADKDGYYDVVFVQSMGTKYDEDGVFQYHYVLTTGKPLMKVVYNETTTNEETGIETTSTISIPALTRIDAALNQEIGDMVPQYLQGYTYEHSKPAGTGMWQKLQWQKFILSTLTDYKGLRTGLLNKSEVDFRYIIDTFESYPDESLKNTLSYLAQQKESALFIANFPSVKTFTKCPYASFTDSKGVFDVNYIVKGCNKKKASSISFSLPDETEGASFTAFYSPLKFTDGYLDTIVPSAGLVSNLFIDKYYSRQPYYIIAGPNYGSINANGLIGPDYKYSIDELQIIEPYGVNVMVYRPSFGTFINANQTAKQTPKSALSYVNVRELVIYLQDEIGRVLQQYQWEINSQRTRQAILDRANQICEITKANDGLYAYVNIMDESNNTPELIDNEFCILSTAIEPGKGAGKMVHELTIYRTGQLSSNTIEL